MTLDTSRLTWTRQPKSFSVSENRITLTTQPHTDLWQRTYYHFRNDNAPVLQMETEEQFFSFEVKTDFSDSDNWIKASVEFENDQYQRLGSVVTNHGYSDWATTDIPASIKQVWYRLSRRGSDYCLESSFDGVNYKQMRICHLWEGAEKIRFGVYACSPEDSSFQAVFTDMNLTECKWLAHDGQQPDEDA